MLPALKVADHRLGHLAGVDVVDAQPQLAVGVLLVGVIGELGGGRAQGGNGGRRSGSGSGVWRMGGRKGGGVLVGVVRWRRLRCDDDVGAAVVFVVVVVRVQVPQEAVVQHAYALVADENEVVLVAPEGQVAKTAPGVTEKQKLYFVS